MEYKTLEAAIDMANSLERSGHHGVIIWDRGNVYVNIDQEWPTQFNGGCDLQCIRFGQVEK